MGLRTGAVALALTGPELLADVTAARFAGLSAIAPLGAFTLDAFTVDVL
ncbi:MULTISPECIES: hypothetical protein [Rhodococcus]|nr:MULTISPECIES: hypothetical protein [Rhodococcus]MCE4268211.1 hypothetical protein [Rhodococcus globerulus]